MKLRKLTYKKMIYIGLAILSVIGLIIFYFSISFPLFRTSYSTTIYSDNGQLLGAQVAQDHQWRFPQGDSVPYKIEKSLLLFEDEYFYCHPGINPISLFRALKQNLQQKEVVSGASTITMQVIRLATQRERTVKSKLIEMVQALRLELGLSKKEILGLYCAHAPFGGNVVGIEAASWRYFQRPPSSLSWAESAMLAVLPNAPGLIHTGKNRELLLKKRNFLLHKLYEEGEIDSLTYSLSVEEEIPPHPFALPQEAPHLLDYLMKKEVGKAYYTSLDRGLQNKVAEIVDDHYSRLSLNHIFNAAVLVVDIHTGKVVAYCGNTLPKNKYLHENNVDIIQAPRSTGSTLKPFLYAAALQEGKLLPSQLLVDIPTFYKNFSPKNYHRDFDGAVPANKALSRSLNVPFVRVLEDYDVARFCRILNKAGVHHINKSPDHYGLSIILGGAESTLFEIVGVYASMMRTLHSYNSDSGVYYKEDFQAPLVLAKDSLQRGEQTSDYPVFSAGSIYTTLEAMTLLERPLEETGWQYFASGRKIAWKTGTSFGFRDAWSVGLTTDYAVGVWVGNATGEGRPDIIGGKTAAPIMFDVFRLFPSTRWVEPPYEDLDETEVCSISGYKAGAYCEVDTVYVPSNNGVAETCPYHLLVHLDQNKQYRVNSECYNVSKMVHQPWFVLPPTMELYYSQKNPLYRKLPPPYKGFHDQNIKKMEFVYPQNDNKLFIPKGIDGEIQAVVLNVAHTDPSATLFWFLDEEYLGQTQDTHLLEAVLPLGKHLLSVTDSQGNAIYKWVDCIGRGDK